MRPVVSSLLITLLLSVVPADDVWGWETAEHKRLGDSVFRSVMNDVAAISGDILIFSVNDDDPIGLPQFLCGDMTFGDLCAYFARDDFRSDRFHDRGRTILEQLRPLTKNRVDSVWGEVSKILQTGAPVFPNDTALTFHHYAAENVVGAYLLHHLLALRLAQSAVGDSGRAAAILNDALIMETLAQSYLADAFSSGHMLVPLEDSWAIFHPRNNRETHDHFRNRGVYVINSRGHVWQTFGDKLMHWYSATYDPLFEACRSSLMELLAIIWHTGDSPPAYLQRWLFSNNLQSTVRPTDSMGAVASWLENYDGPVYYADLRMPTLMLLPMPVAASWSFRTQDTTEHGIRWRRHFPQLREDGYHDPDLSNIDLEFLYSRQAIPDWLIPEPLRAASPTGPYTLIATHPDWASVRWVQNRYAPPSYKGLLIRGGLHRTTAGGDWQTGGIIGLGYGVCDDLILFKNLSIDMTVMPSMLEPRRSILTVTGGGGLAFLLADWIKALHAEAGIALGLHDEFDNWGGMIAAGLDSEVYPLKFTNVGLTIRVKYQWVFFDRTLRGPALELILQ